MSQSFRMGMMLPVEHVANDSIQTRLKNLLEAARFAEQAGFKFLDAPQHFLAAPSQYLHCIPLLARVAAEVNDMDLGTNIIQLTLHNPVNIAEELATLDIICGGRLLVGFGRGYREDEFKAFGVEEGTRLTHFLEALEIVKRLWTEDSVTFHGKHFQLEEASIGIRPLQRPCPPIVIAASGNRMIARSARIADGWTAAGHATLDGLMEQVPVYKQALAAEGKDFPPKHYRLTLETCVGRNLGGSAANRLALRGKEIRGLCELGPGRRTARRTEFRCANRNVSTGPLQYWRCRACGRAHSRLPR